MKKIYLALLLCCAIPFGSHAQIGEGGFPVSNKYQLNNDYDQVVLQRPDYEQLQREDAKDVFSPKPYRAGVGISADLDIHKQGSWSYMPDGTRIWRLSVVMPEAKAVVLFYDKFYLPKGVKLFLQNENGRQLLGAYTYMHNTETNTFSNEPVQGSRVNIEMNIDPSVNISEIQYHIFKVGAMYRGVDGDFAAFETPLVDPYNPPQVAGQSAKCHINAICPQMNDFADERTSVVRILIASDSNFNAQTSIGFCTGTIINNTGNSGTNCTPLLLTASHCDDANSREDEHYQFWQFRFNYLTSNCDGTGLPTPTSSPTLTAGASFKARSNNPSFPSTGGLSLVQDFLLLKLNDALPSGYNIHLAGWNRKAVFTASDVANEYTVFAGMHHPGGDYMKLITAPSIDGTAQFNQNSVPATHWRIFGQEGGTSPGSSGSALFDIYGRVIGDLSGGPDGNCNIDSKAFMPTASYSKLSLGWENTFDQTAFPAYAGAQSRLKDALDPTNSNVMSLETKPITACDNIGIKGVGVLNNDAFDIYPNPSADGKQVIKFNFAKAEDVYIHIYNALGQKVKDLFIGKVINNDFSLDLSTLPGGVYTVNVIAGNNRLAKRLVISK